ncbi:hypothetical protein COLO4_33281 [Corchorus olitorius]|uniref:RNase H type-1 domain-containing protein n=1 Tax=Corchorus olitorius TaxID=93759 RepID=A0A1R3GV83_9ROSI|nr:hypothetical protein COLO4_33281 [Corchorus olitorius]
MLDMDFAHYNLPKVSTAPYWPSGHAPSREASRRDRENTKLHHHVLFVFTSLFVSKVLNSSFHQSVCSQPATLVANVKQQLDSGVVYLGENLEYAWDAVAVFWLAPSPRMLKLNVDAAYREDLRVATLAMVLRDHVGKVLLCGLLKLENIPSITRAEFLAIRFGVEEVKEANYVRVIVESDCATAVS